MRRHLALLRCGLRLLAATVSGNPVAFDNAADDIESIHAGKAPAS